ncbi:diguanylate cyclase [Candidatus Peregrinibacteria bacterium]|nr:diguanylate cyclase [Candidatus Peregrinibacteria bacterium]
MPFQNIPFYDPLKTYDQNCHEGPFGAFADDQAYPNVGEPQIEFLRQKISSDFGIPAGPLPNSKFVKAAFRKGFDLPMYKTVRTQAHPCNGFPNVVPVGVEGDLTLEKATQGLVTEADFTPPIAITNSFGVPSLDPKEWQPDMREAVEAAGNGQVMIASFQGTNRGQGVEAFVQDHVLGARLVKETGAKIMELNLSCPNEGKSTLLCHDTDLVERIATEIKNEIGDTPLLLKMAYFPSDEGLLDFLNRLSSIVQGFSAINTIASSVRKPNGEQALPGERRLVSGVCGAPIKWAGLEMVKRMDAIRQRLQRAFVIVGVGGVTTPQDYLEYKSAGAEAVMSATGAMWNAELAREIKGV